MWGNIVLEVSFITNFHLGFNNTRSDVLIHLIQWQYWWWFWFSYWWGLYFLLFMRIFRFRTLKFRPRIATTYRSHGKWGDLIICLLPVSWCVNIISNSSFILRMIEWQAESSLFTLRIRGRQWYWIYKYDLKTVTDLLTVPKNIGHNKWQITTPNELQISDDYLHILQLRIHNKWVKRYWDEFLEKTIKENNFNIASSLELQKNLVINEVVPQKLLNFTLLYNINDLEKKFNLKTNLVPDEGFFLKKLFNNPAEELLDGYREENNIFVDDLFSIDSKLYWTQFKTFKSLLNTNIYNYKLGLDNYIYNHENFLEVTRWTKRTQGTISPCRLIKYPISNQRNIKINGLESDLLRLRFNEPQSKLIHKPISHNNYLVMKQKKYKPLKTVSLRIKYLRDTLTMKNTKIAKYSGKMTLFNHSIFAEDDFNSTLRYKFFKKFKKQNENIPVALWKRLLRTKRTLVLPAHVNITAITNSYDVIHSWFIPGLGLKMDCIPGRATHHVLHIDNVGFYYGQCAEICGRYHHHMPIRICALPFEHFLIWWHTFGLTKLMYVGTDKRCFTKDYALRKYIW